ncbi:MAG: DUF2442 domain-containing protein [Candidatus Electrothrix sp. AR4]|nr:DUF2442 domain-containing protein [Candidatus Electrothrix sp. AR4]
MFTHVEQEKYISGYKIWLSFNDSSEGKIDLSSELYGLNSIEWENGLDLDPEFLYQKIIAVENA